MFSNFTAIILSGGKSRRMENDKSLLLLKGKPIIEILYNLLENFFQEVLIISNDIEKYQFLTNNIYQDVYPGFGPLSGIHSGLVNSNNDFNFVVSCDMPFINEELLKYLVFIKSNFDIIIPKSNSSIHSLCGIYKKSCINSAEELLKKAANNKNNYYDKTKIKLFDLINSVNSNIFDISKEKFYHKDLMFNMNTKEDYDYVKKKYDSLT